MKEIKVAMIGYGGIGAMHKAAYDALAREGYPIRLVAICDRNKDALNSSSLTNLGAVDVGSFDDISFYSECDELLRNEDFDMADVCLPTFLHKEYTVKLLSAGKHVLCEKPMALSYEDCLEMLCCSEKYGRELMIGQCLRFDPAYLYLKELVDGGEFGKARRISMGRFSFMPRWSNWFTDTKKSGGCMIDFHIHDIDMLRFVFGEPHAVSSVSHDEGSGWQYVSSRLYYDGLIAMAEASFDESPTAPFSMWYRVRFDNATVVFDTDKVTVYPDDAEPFVKELSKDDRMVEELRYFASVILGDKGNTVHSPSGAARSIRTVELIRESARCGGEIIKI